MLCDSTKTLLRTIVESLQTPDESAWDDQIESGNQCLYEMHQMTRPSFRAYKTTPSEKWPLHVPDGSGLNRAMPHVKAMMSAIRRKDRATALESGRAALDEMNASAIHRSAGTAEELRAPTVNSPMWRTRQLGKHPPAVKQRNSSRRCRVASSK